MGYTKLHILAFYYFVKLNEHLGFWLTRRNCIPIVSASVLLLCVCAWCVGVCVCVYGFADLCVCVCVCTHINMPIKCVNMYAWLDVCMFAHTIDIDRLDPQTLNQPIRT